MTLSFKGSVHLQNGKMGWPNPTYPQNQVDILFFAHDPTHFVEETGVGILVKSLKLLEQFRRWRTNSTLPLPQIIKGPLLVVGSAAAKCLSRGQVQRNTQVMDKGWKLVLALTNAEIDKCKWCSNWLMFPWKLISHYFSKMLWKTISWHQI